jgi:hypothetical protein
MVAYTPRIPPDRRPTLSPDVANRLREALTARWARPDDSDAALRTALRDAVLDAKQQKLRPEELLVALKTVEQEVADSLERVDVKRREALRHWVVGVCMRAYFGDDDAAG